MKHLFILGLFFMPILAMAAGPSTTCPSGFVTVDEPYLTVENGSCPAGYTAAGTASSCLVASPDGSCMMYAPANTQYSNDYGTYHFNQICPLK